MVLFITVLIGDLEGVLPRTLMLFLFLALWGLGISSRHGVISRLLVLSLATFLLLFHSGFAREFLSLGVLFGLTGLILGLWGLFVSLIVPRIETYLQGIFFFRVFLI